MVKIKYNLEAAQDMQKIYVEKDKTYKEFRVGDHVFWKVKAKKSSLKFGCYSKLAACYCGLFEILERIGPIPHMLVFHASMHVHNVYFLKNDVHDPNHIIDWTMI